MKLSDYVADFIAQQGIRHVFLISGGAIIHCVDSVARHPALTYVCTQHEQGAGQAADAYARITNHLGVAMVTSGPGATNLVTSVCNAYFDSIPLLIISGQVSRPRLKPNKHLRQKGFQETDVISIFKSVVKYAVQIQNPEDICYELTKAVYLAKSGRPGPVLIDLPDDVQRVEIDPNALREFTPAPSQAPSVITGLLDELFEKIQLSQRPVLILGAGIRIAKIIPEAIKFAEYFRLPVVLTWGAMDCLPFEHPLNMGGCGICGPRAGNFAVQKSDLIVALGTRLSQQVTGGKSGLFAPRAKKILVDIDAYELTKFKKDEVNLDLKIECDLHNFFNECQKRYTAQLADLFAGWRNQIKDWAREFPICPSENYEKKDMIDIYVFMKELSRAAREGDIVITDAGGNLSWTMQAFEVKKNQRLFSAWNHSPMGFSLPASIGAALAGTNDVICIIGDGGIMMCLAELATIRRYNLPVKIFVINNHGHGIQKQTIDTWLNSNYVAVDEKTGLAFPDFLKVAETFKLPAVSVDSHKNLSERIKEILAAPGPILCNVEMEENQKIEPFLKFGAGLEDLSPPLPRDVLASIMQDSKEKRLSLIQASKMR